MPCRFHCGAIGRGNFGQKFETASLQSKVTFVYLAMLAQRGALDMAFESSRGAK